MIIGMMLNEVRLTILTWLIIVLQVFAGFTQGNRNTFVINRNRLQGDIRISRDSFMIPSSMCNRTLPRTGYECEQFNADLNGNKRCSCLCPDDRATFAFHNSEWTCLENGKIRDLQDCKNKTFFADNTNFPRQLWALTVNDSKHISILYDHSGISGWWNCEVYPNLSWYLGYNGTRLRSSLYLRTMEKLFGFSPSYLGQQFSLKVNSGVHFAHLLEGKIINLGIRCTRPNRPPYHSCLMFKLIGQQTCSESVPRLQRSSTVKPQHTTYTPESLATSSTTTPLPSSISITTNTESVTVRLPPKSGRERSTDGLSSIGLIAGISIASSIAILVIIIVGYIVYRRRFSNKTWHASRASNKENKQDIVTMNPQMNLPISHEDENGYRALSIGAIEQQIYAPSYSVPQRQGAREDGPISAHMYAPLNVPAEHNIYGPRNDQELEPVYNVLEQPESITELQNGPICLEQPLYNILEGLSNAEGLKGPVNYGVEPLYNILEGPYIEIAEREGDYGAISSGTQSTTAGSEQSLNQGTEPVYNVLEGPYAVDEEGSGDSGAISSEGSIYNALEQPQADKHYKANCDTEGKSDPVYHVLEENTYENT